MQDLRFYLEQRGVLSEAEQRYAGLEGSHSKEGEKKEKRMVQAQLTWAKQWYVYEMAVCSLFCFCF